MRFALSFFILVRMATAQDSAADLYKRAQDHAANMEWSRAREDYEAALKLRPDFRDARLALAKVQMQQRDYDGVLASAVEVLRTDPNSVEAEGLRAAALIHVRKPGVARLFMLDALKVHPENPELLFQLGSACLSDERWMEAEEAFRTLSRVEPGTARGIAGLAEIHMVRKEPALALKLLQDEVAKAPQRADLHMELGNTAARTGNLDLAIAEYRKADAGLTSDSTRATLYSSLGQVYGRKGDLDNSIATLEKARRIQPNNPLVLSVLGMSLDSAGRKTEARDVYEACLKLEPQNGQILNNLAYLLADTGSDLKRALDLAQRARESLPFHPEVTDTLGWIYLKSDRAGEAMSMFRSLVESRPDNPVFRYHFAASLFQIGDKKGAEEQLQIAMKLKPSPSEERGIRELEAKLK